MKIQDYLIGLLVLILAFSLVLLAVRSEHRLEAHLPPKGEFPNALAAYAGATVYVGQHGGVVMKTSGTPSMEPFIHGVNFVVIDETATYDTAQVGDLTAYRAKWLNGALVLHVIAAREPGGFVMSGIGNAHSEPLTPVGPADYVGKCVYVAAYPNTPAAK